MMGPDIDSDNDRGIIPRMVKGIFKMIMKAPENIEFTVKVSIIEIYNERIRDLLDLTNTDLKIYEERGKGVFVRDITEKYLGNEEEVL